MSTVLVAYATRYGSTQGVAEFIAKALGEKGLTVDLMPLSAVTSLEKYSAVVIGAPIYIGSWLKPAHDFLKRFEKSLQTLPVAVFALGPLSNSPKEMEESRAQLDTQLAKHAWFRPLAIEMFVGKYEKKNLPFFFKLLAMLPASPLRSAPEGDHRNWEHIGAWAETLPAKLGAAS